MRTVTTLTAALALAAGLAAATLPAAAAQLQHTGTGKTHTHTHTQSTAAQPKKTHTAGSVKKNTGASKVVVNRPVKIDRNDERNYHNKYTWAKGNHMDGCRQEYHECAQNFGWGSWRFRRCMAQHGC